MLRLPDGNLSASGTEYGIAWGMDHANKHRGIPPLNVYRNRSTPTLPLEPKPSAKPLASNGTPCRTFLQISAKTARGIPPQLLATITTSRNLRRPSKALDCGGGRQRRRRLLRCLGGRAAGATCAAGHWRDPESPNAIRDLASELREHSSGFAFRIRDAVDHAAREWKIQYSHDLRERERHLRASGRSDEADFAHQQRETLELSKGRLVLVVDQLEELFTSGFSPEVRQKYILALVSLAQSGRVFILATLRSDFSPSYQEFPDLI